MCVWVSPLITFHNEELFGLAQVEENQEFVDIPSNRQRMKLQWAEKICTICLSQGKELLYNNRNQSDMHVIYMYSV